MRFTRRDFLKLTGLGGATLILPLRVPPPIRVLRILAPSRTLATLPIRIFEREMNVKVVVETLRATSLQNKQTSKVFETFEVLNFDLAIVPSHTITHLIRNNLIRELNLQSPITNYQQRPYDPFNTFSVLASRGVIGINARNIQPPQTWTDFFTLAQHTRTYLPSFESLNAALKSFGESINTRNTHIREKAQSLILNLPSSPLDQAQLAIAPPLEGWNFVAPHEGAEMWEDSFCIPRSSMQVELAQKFIEFAVQRQNIVSVEGEILSAFALA